MRAASATTQLQRCYRCSRSFLHATHRQREITAERYHNFPVSTSTSRSLATSAQKLSFRRATRRQRQHASLSHQPPPTTTLSTTADLNAATATSAASPSFDASTLTPMMQQWSALKQQHPEHLLLFRLGDFYELFYQDAITASSILSLTLTSRLSIPMCGFPHYVLPQHLRKLLAANTTAAVCEQTETVVDRQKRAGKGKGVVDREVVRIVTKGTLVEEGWLNPKHFNYLLSLYSTASEADGKVGMCWLDVSTGVFEHSSVANVSALSHEMARLQPAEVLLPPSLAERADVQRLLAGYTTTVRDEAAWSEDLTTHIHSWQQLAEERRRQADDGNDEEHMHADADVDSLPPLLAAPAPFTAAESGMTELHPADLLLQCSGVELRACSAVLDYLLYTHRKSLPRLFSLPAHATSSSSTYNVMWIDGVTRRSLELTHSSSRQTRTGSLLHTIDHTLTSAGARLLSSYLASPLTSRQAINERLDMVEWAYDDRGLMEGIRGRLKQVEDVQRGVQRIVMRKGGGGAREMRAIVRTIEKGREIAQLLQSSCLMRQQSGRTIPPSIQPLLTLLTHPSLQSLASLLDSAIVDEPPALLEHGGFIRHSYHAPLATLSSSSVSSQDAIDALQARYRRVLSLPTLKIKKNTGIGYYIEVSATKAERLEEERSALRSDEADGDGGSERAELLRGLSLFQQLRNEYRYKSRPLLSLQNSLTLTSDELHSLELMLYGRLRSAVITHSSLLSSLAQALATLDVYCGLAHLARDGGYVRPVVLEGAGDEGEVLEVEAGRHPVVEARLYARYRDKEKQRQKETLEVLPAAEGDEEVNGDNVSAPPAFILPSASSAPYLDFTPNDCHLSTTTAHLCLLTGPNMAGKSTYLRQNALLVLLASIGSFVPAASLRFTPVDRLFSRVGGSVSDDLSRDQSTFMNEMLELSAILHHATRRSLVIVDEVGRGTSTFDGLAIALASLEWLHDVSDCRALFATHYHELAMAQERLRRMSCWKMEVEEEEQEAVNGGKATRGGASEVHFLHRVVPGVVSSSYGIHVARLAGLPSSVSSRAEQVLGELEGGKDSYKQLVRRVVVGTTARDTTTTPATV